MRQDTKILNDIDLSHTTYYEIIEKYVLTVIIQNKPPKIQLDNGRDANETPTTEVDIDEFIHEPASLQQ